MKSRIVLVFSSLLLFAGIYFGGVQNLTEKQEANDSNQTAGIVSQGTPVDFVSQGAESSVNDSDLVATYTQLYGKYQVKVYANRKFSVFTDQEIETLRLEAAALDKLYSQMTLEQRTKIKRAAFPFVRLEVDGKFTFKKAEDLTPEERKSLNC
ncbi:MAG: hypothetical protein FJX97_04420 [Bacteroidetes bacterium]|nr:hypothetical protein [Bacteroidota bacterium]